MSATDADDGPTDSGTVAARRRLPRRAHRVPFAVLLAAILVGGMVALLGLNTASAANQVAQRKYDAANASLSDQEQQLGRDLASRQSPAELAKAAYKLGLIPAANPAFLRFNKDGSVTILGTTITIPAPANPSPKKSASRSASTSATKSKQPSSKASAKSGARKSASKSSASKKPGSNSTPSSSPGPTPSTPAATTTTLPGGPR